MLWFYEEIIFVVWMLDENEFRSGQFLRGGEKDTGPTRSVHKSRLS